MSQFDAVLQGKIAACDVPTMGYRRGEDGEIEKDVFDGVIPKGWADSPASVDDPASLEAERETQPSDFTEAEGFPSEPAPLAPPYTNYSYRELSTELKRRTGKGARPADNAETLMAQLNELDAEERREARTGEQVV